MCTCAHMLTYVNRIVFPKVAYTIRCQDIQTYNSTMLTAVGDRSFLVYLYPLPFSHKLHVKVLDSYFTQNNLC